MLRPETDDKVDAGQGLLLQTLQQLLEIEATGVGPALDQASHLVAEALGADKVDAFLYDPSRETLVAAGTSDTPMGIRQHEIGMDVLPIANGGRAIEVFQDGSSYLTGRADHDPGVLAGFSQGLGIRSLMSVPLDVAGQRRGVLQAASKQEDKFSQQDLRFLESVAHWVGAIAHRAELVERIARDAAEQGRRVAADELVTVLAHDLGNHLAPLKGRIDMLRRRASREERQRDIVDADEALHALGRIQQLIGELLDAGRLEQGLFTPATQPADLAALAREVADRLRSEETEIHVRTPDDLVAQVDPGRICQVLENLLTNAIRHSPLEMPITLEVRRERREDGDWAVLTVQDEGPGIAPELLPTLFQRYATGPDSRGLGLGLFVARGIAEAHGGTLTAESIPGKGASFHLSLPLEGPG